MVFISLCVPPVSSLYTEQLKRDKIPVSLSAWQQQFQLVMLLDWHRSLIKSYTEKNKTFLPSH